MDGPGPRRGGVGSSTRRKWPEVSLLFLLPRTHLLLSAPLGLLPGFVTQCDPHAFLPWGPCGFQGLKAGVTTDLGDGSRGCHGRCEKRSVTQGALLGLQWPPRSQWAQEEGPFQKETKRTLVVPHLPLICAVSPCPKSPPPGDTGGGAHG